MAKRDDIPKADPTGIEPLIKRLKQSNIGGFHISCVNGHNARDNFRGKDRSWPSLKKSSMNF
jgi:hypothetical protein